MTSQLTPTSTNNSPLLSGNGCFGSPASGRSINSSGELLLTPKQNPIRNPVLDKLKNGGDLTKSPVLRIPESPVMQRLGYGTGVGVYLFERSPKVGGDLRSPWAIKKTIQVADTSVDESNKVFACRIQYEAEILKKLSHPNIIGYRAFGQTAPGSTYLAMEKANQSLADLIEERVEDVLVLDDCESATPFPAAKIQKVAVEVGKALTYLHDEVRMVHGDLKSANVLVFGDFEKIKLCDFGVARKLAKDGTVEGTYVGTEIWCPMEVIRQKRRLDHVPITHKADIFPFGLTLYEMITLKPPHLSSAEESCFVGDTTTSTINTTTDSGSVSSSEGDNTLANESFDELAYEEALARHVGTRPPLPDIEFVPSYTTILGIFYYCTEEDPTKRPDAKDIVAALTDAEKESVSASSG